MKRRAYLYAAMFSALPVLIFYIISCFILSGVTRSLSDVAPDENAALIVSAIENEVGDKFARLSSAARMFAGAGGDLPALLLESTGVQVEVVSGNGDGAVYKPYCDESGFILECSVPGTDYVAVGTLPFESVRSYGARVSYGSAPETHGVKNSGMNFTVAVSAPPSPHGVLFPVFTAIAGLILAAVFSWASARAIRRDALTPLTELAKEADFDDAGNELETLRRGIGKLTGEIKSRSNNIKFLTSELSDAKVLLHQGAERLRESERRLRIAVETSTMAIFEIVPPDYRLFCSDSWERVTGFAAPENFPMDYFSKYMLHPDNREAVADWLRAGGKFDGDIRVSTETRTYKWLRLCAAIAENGIVSGTVTDVNDQVSAREKAMFSAYYDSVTDLPRRTRFVPDVSARLEKLGTDRWGAIIILSIEDFKRVNDIYGFAVGDQTLRKVADSLRDHFKSGMYIARSSGNSFLLYGAFPRRMEPVCKMIDDVLDIFCHPFIVGDLSITISVRLGASLYPSHASSVEELIRSADIAMHNVEGGKQNLRYRLFDPDMMVIVERSHQVLEVLRHFEEYQAMFVQYQPIVRAADRSVHAFESLVRMDTSPIGFISPAEFIPLAEQSKMIIPIGTEVLRRSCIRARELLDIGYKFDHISVNASVVQLAESDFADVVLATIEECGIPYNMIQIEITESELVSNFDDTMLKLHKLQSKGVTIALDDFGTGYSSMKYLREIPLNTIKIDKHFVDEIDLGMEKLLAVTMIQLSHDLGHTVVCEGVETENQFDVLRDNGADFIQGYLVSRPLYSDDIERWLDEWEDKRRLLR